MQGIIITAKHHDGFCLWPSKYSTHTVRESPWKNGSGDILKELSEACREYGLKFGVYLSPWDRNHPDYGTPAYNRTFANTLNEVLSGYGEVFEQWFDGANGEGHGGKKQTYDWDMFHKVVYRNQPQAIVFSDIGPGCRWMGNEQGIAGETNWSTLNVKGYGPGRDAPPVQVLNAGVQGGEAWVPAETDVSIRPGWFYSPSTDDKVKSVDKLMDIYYTSVGRNSNLLLNVPPDRRGRIHPKDSLRLMDFRRAREEAFSENLISGAAVKASNTRGGSLEYATSKILDNDYDSYWAANDGELSPYLEIDLKKEKTFNRLLLQEYIPLGQRVSALNVKYWDKKAKNWKKLTEATTIGYKRILRFPAITSQKLKIEFNALASPVISSIGIYKSPELLSAPVISRDKAGIVTIRCKIPGSDIFYTRDGKEPDNTSKKYDRPFPLPDGGIIKAVVIAGVARKSETVTVFYDIAPAKWTVISPAVNNTANIIDGNPRTSAELAIAAPLTVDLGQSYVLKGFTYRPVGKVQAANIYKYDFYVSADGQEWIQVKSNAVFSNIANNPVRQEVLFDSPEQGRYIKIKPQESVGNKDSYTIGEIGIITR